MTTGSSPIGTPAQALQPGAPVSVTSNVQTRTNTAALMIISGVLAYTLTYLILGFGYAIVLFTAVVIATGCYYFAPQEGDTEEHSAAFRTMQYIFCGIWLTAAFNEIFRAFRIDRPSTNRNSRLAERRCPMFGRYRPGTMLPSNHPAISQSHVPLESTRYDATYWEEKRSGTSHSNRGQVQETQSVPSISGQVQETRPTTSILSESGLDGSHLFPSPSHDEPSLENPRPQSSNRGGHTRGRGISSRGRGTPSRGRGTSSRGGSSSRRGRRESSLRGRS